jgi:transcriptional regulator GlxA family with amidase domain
MSESAPRTLGAVLYPQFELLDLYGPLEMFGALEKEIRIVTVAETKGPVASTPGVETVARYDFGDCPRLDLILVPGGIGTLPQLGNEALLDFLRKRSAQAELTMSVCSGSALLARAGLLDGRRATSNKMFFQLARSQSDKVRWVTAARWVEDGPFATSSGVSAGTDMALAVIAKLFGPARAEQVAIGTEYTWHRDADRDPFAQYLDKAGVLASKEADESRPTRSEAQPSEGR